MKQEMFVSFSLMHPQALRGVLAHSKHLINVCLNKIEGDRNLKSEMGMEAILCLWEQSLGCVHLSEVP
jgi:hypothetical protein